jgi:predicted RNA-binding Zn-ribbon protein involved in translation (DUF1610 family)
LASLAVAFFPCPECGKLAKCLEVRKRQNDTDVWKYRRYECSSEHKFSTQERVYKPKRGDNQFTERGNE